MVDYRDKNIYYFSANGAMPNNTSGGTMFKVLSLGILVNVATGEILDAGVNMVNALCSNFIIGQLVGLNIEKDWDDILASFDRLQIPAQKSVIVALKAVKEKYQKFSKVSYNGAE